MKKQTSLRCSTALALYSPTLPLFFLLLLLGLLVHPTNALNASHIAVEFVDDAQSCTSMKLIASNMQVTCNNGDGSSADCQSGDEAEITGDRK